MESDKTPFGANIARPLLIVANLMVPLLCSLAPLFALGKNPTDLVPVWGDEVWWWQQARAVGVYGAPLGYWGYDGSHAAIGTFATWGPASMMPYGLFAAVFGWNYWSFFSANLLYTTIAIALFIKFTGISIRGLVLLLPVNLLQVVRNLYLTTAMAESCRYSFGLITVGVLVYAYDHWDKMGVMTKYILIPGWLIFIGQFYLIFCLFVLPYGVLLLRSSVNAWQIRLLSAGIGTTIYILLSRKLLRSFCAPYIQSAGGGTRLFAGLNNLWGWITDSAKPVFLRTYLLFAIAIAVLCSIHLLSVAWHHFDIQDDYSYAARERALSVLGNYILVAFVGGYLIMYKNIELWTMVRGFSVGVLLISFLVCCVNDGKIYALLFIGLLCTTMCVPQVFETFYNENRFRSFEWDTQVIRTQRLLDDVLDLNVSTANHWENTVESAFTSDALLTLCLPTGMASNSLAHSWPIGKARWVAVGDLDSSESIELIEGYQRIGYIEAASNGQVLILERTGDAP